MKPVEEVGLDVTVSGAVRTPEGGHTVPLTGLVKGCRIRLVKGGALF